MATAPALSPSAAAYDLIRSAFDQEELPETLLFDVQSRCVNSSSCRGPDAELSCVRSVLESYRSPERLAETMTELRLAEQGALVFDSAAAEACIAALSKCDLTFDSLVNERQRPGGACMRAVVGTKPPGASCVTNHECASELCDGCEGENVCCSGACEEEPVEQSMVDGPCSRRQFCAEGLWCSSVNGGTCQPRLLEDEDCDSLDQCADDLVCRNGRCKQPRQRGESCSPGETPCALPGDFCNPDSETCGPFPSEGESCDFSDPPCLNCCASGLRCDVDSGTCVERVFANAGERCSVHSDCDVGLFCSVVAVPSPGQACVPRRGTGEACNEDLQCQSLNCELVSTGPDRRGTCGTVPQCMD